MNICTNEQMNDIYRKRNKLKQQYKYWLSSDKLSTTFGSFVVFDSLDEALEDMGETLACISEDPDVRKAADLIGHIAGISNGLMITVTGFDSEGDNYE